MSEFNINMLVTSDTHGYITPYQYYDHKNNQMGLAKLAAYIKKHKKEENTILIDLGDTIQGSPLTYYNALFSHDQKNIFAEILNHLNYDAVILGNHEFNFGLEYLDDYINTLNCKVLSANIVKGNLPFTKYAYLIKEFKNGPKIALVGLTTHFIPRAEIPENMKDLSFIEPMEIMPCVIKELKSKEKFDCLVVCYHGGFECDLQTGELYKNHNGENQGYQLLTKIDDIDVLLTAHQHKSIAINDLCHKAITQTEGNGKELAQLTIKFTNINGKWYISDKKTQLIEAYKEEISESIMEMIKPLEEQTQQWLSQSIKDYDQFILNLFYANLTKHPLMNMISSTNAYLGQTQSTMVTMRDIFSSYIYYNLTLGIEVTGEGLINAINALIKLFDCRSSTIYLKHYRYEVEGLRFLVNSFNQIEHITFNNELFSKEKKYILYLKNYGVSGLLDTFSIFKPNKIPTNLLELIIFYIQQSNEKIIQNIFIYQ